MIMARLSTNLHPKLTDSIISILSIKKIKTVFDFVAEDSEKIMQYSNCLSYQEIIDIKKNITKLYVGGIKKGDQLLKDNRNNVTPTGIPCLDNLINGGLSGGQIYELCGLSSSGKSQLCHTIAVNVLCSLPRHEIVHYVDTKGDFCGERILTILKSKKLNEEEQGSILNNIMVTGISSIEELMNFLHSLKEESNKQKTKIIKLVIIDSLPAIFFKFNTETSWAANTSALNHLANILRCLSNEFNLPLITTNLITQWRENYGFQNTAFSNDNTVSKAALGKYWASIPNTRLLIETIELEKRRITVWKSSCLSTGSSCHVNISNSGVS